MRNALTSSRAEVISLYVYERGLRGGDYSFGTAVGMMNSVINTCMIIAVNWIANKISDGEQGLF